MDAAKQAINKLTSNHGHHTTEIHEHYKPAVTHEHIAPTREHQDTTVIDNEVHQDHYHTSVLPVKHKEVLPTEHSHKIAEAKHVEHQHGDHQGIRSKIAAEAATFKNKTETAPVETTHTVTPAVAAEHHHHHVHETIQPVIQKQTIQPSVVHTTIPVHEVHHNEPKHYTASALPAVTLDEFKTQGGSLTGLADRVERFEGEPENIANKGLRGHMANHSSTKNATMNENASTRMAGTTNSNATSNTMAGTGRTERSGSSDYSTTGTTESSHIGEPSKAQQYIDSRVDKPGRGTSGMATGTGAGTTMHGKDTSNDLSRSSTDSGKASLLSKLNPFKDSDGDGKKGVMT